jgi:hypothetical protein
MRQTGNHLYFRYTVFASMQQTGNHLYSRYTVFASMQQTGNHLYSRYTVFASMQQTGNHLYFRYRLCKYVANQKSPVLQVPSMQVCGKPEIICTPGTVFASMRQTGNHPYSRYTVEPGKIDYETIFKSKLKLCTLKKMQFFRS